MAVRIAAGGATNNEGQMIQRIKDWLLERGINQCVEDLGRTENAEQRECTLSTLEWLINQRSPQQVARMERQKGLC